MNVMRAFNFDKVILTPTKEMSWKAIVVISCPVSTAVPLVVF